VIRHFRHKADRCSHGSGGGGGGEGDPHLRAKGIAVETLSEFYPDGNAVSEREFDLSGPFNNKRRIGDAVVEFDNPHTKFGSGIVIEVQDKHEDKDVLSTTRVYLDNGYSVCWLSTEEFGKYSLKYGKSEFEALLKNQFPDGESVFETNLNPDGTVPNKTMYPLVATAWPDSVEVAKETRPRVSSGWNYSAFKKDGYGPLLLNSESVNLGIHSNNKNIPMPSEFYKQLARRYFRETDWAELFEPYTWDSRLVKEQWGELTSLDEMEVKIPLAQWLAEDNLLMVSGKEARNVFGSDFRLSEDARFADAAKAKTAFVPIDFFEELSSEAIASADKVSIDVGLERAAIQNPEFYIPDLIEWSATKWNVRFTGTLEEPIGDDLVEHQWQNKQKIPLNYWLAEHGVPASIERHLRLAFDVGQNNMPDYEEDKKEAMERIPRIIKHNTSGPQPDLIKKRTLLTVASAHANIDHDAVEWALTRLIDKGEIKNPEEKRYSLAT
jgi:hypothetical protein